jgi:hypothetical protein
MTALPELPIMPDQGFMSSFELARVQRFCRAYGESCRIAGMEAAAVICERINTESGGGFEPFADAIRAAASVQNERHRTA